MNKKDIPEFIQFTRMYVVGVIWRAKAATDLVRNRAHFGVVASGGLSSHLDSCTSNDTSVGFCHPL